MQVFPDSPKQLLTKSWLYSWILSQFYHPICSKQARPAERRNGEVSPARSRTWQVFAPRDCQMWLSTFKFGMFVETCLIFFILYPIQEPYRDPIVRRFWNDSSGTHVWKSHCARAASKSCQRVKYHVALSAKKETIPFTNWHMRVTCVLLRHQKCSKRLVPKCSKTNYNVHGCERSGVAMLITDHFEEKKPIEIHLQQLAGAWMSGNNRTSENWSDPAKSHGFSTK